jgi:hypothetical protein
MRPLSRLAGNQNYGAMLEHLKLDITLEDTFQVGDIFFHYGDKVARCWG